MLKVVVGVFHSDCGIYMQRRKEGRSFAGRWECPGGKVEEGESLEDALRREWREETGTDLAQVGPLISKQTFTTGHTEVPCEVYLFEVLPREPKLLRGHEGEPAAYFLPTALRKLPVVPSLNAVVADLLIVRTRFL